MTWKIPPRIKVFEALGSVADGRVEIIEKDPSTALHSTQDDSTLIAKVTSSDGSKFYTVKYNEERNAITSNDNGSRWQGYLGYPSIAVLMKLGKLPYDPELAESLKGIEWKKINTQFKNDWSKTEEYLFATRDKERLETFAEQVLEESQKSKVEKLK